MYSHGVANYSNPSFSSTSHSSRQDVNSLKHTLSSPLAEYYARDEVLGQVSSLEINYRLQSNGDDKHQHPQSIDGLHATPEIEGAIKLGPSKIPFDDKSGRPDRRRHELMVPMTSPTTLTRDTSRSLLSPISFTSPTNPSESSNTAGHRSNDEHTERSHPKALNRTVANPHVVADSNQCVFPNCEINRESTEDEVAAIEKFGGKSTVKPRALSLGECMRSKSTFVSPSYVVQDGSQLRKTLHKTTGSRELRQSASSVPPQQTSGNHGPPRNSRPRLWIDGHKDDERIEEAQLTTVTHSPTKPKVITIPRRSSSVSPLKAPSLSLHELPRCAERRPATPPETPQSGVGLSVSSRTSHTEASSHGVFSGKAPPLSMTPPSSRLATPWMRNTVRRPSKFDSQASRVEAVARTLHLFNPDKGAALWVMGELEAAINNHPTARLYLDSPIVEHIRSLCSVRSSQEIIPERTCKDKLTAPHSRYSIFRPLSSHPVAAQDAQSKSPTYCKDLHNGLSASPCNATLSALRIIFPHAPGALLDSLQATYLALNYVSSLPYPVPAAPCVSASRFSPAPSGLTFSSIPRKALATLGIQAPTTSPAAGTSWLRSETPDMNGREMKTEDSSVQQQNEKERMENLQVSLRISVRGLLGEIEGRRLGKRDESLVRAVGEVVRYGEGAALLSM
ncbi:MAG: hypothetical protein Q9195_002725 [Heterodermia aff. obscurata]